MKKQTLLPLIAFIALLLLPDYSFAQKANLDSEQLAKIYLEAVHDASRNLTTKDIYTKLVSLKYGTSKYTQWNICEKDTMILVASFQKKDWEPIKLVKDSVLNSPDNIDDLIWISIPKELEERLTDFKNYDSQSLKIRLNQILGLPPVDKYSIIYYFWVNKNNLLRPSYNSDITVTESSIDFPMSVSKEHKEWLTKYISDSYNNPQPMSRYPFTRLGYTYDWSPATPRYGVSEFIIKPNSPLRLAKKIDIEAGERW